MILNYTTMCVSHHIGMDKVLVGFPQLEFTIINSSCRQVFKTVLIGDGLKMLSPDESQKLRDLTPLQLSFLRILQETDDEDFTGEVPISEVESKLIASGFSKDEVEWLSIADRVYRVKTNRDGVSVRCYMIIPEYEKTKEYKKFQEESELRATEKELRTMQLEDEEN